MSLPSVSVKHFASNYPSIANCLPADWSGTALDILSMTHCKAKARICVVTGFGFMSAKVLRLFAVDCAMHALSKESIPDPRSLAACDVAKKFANNAATDEELGVARKAARAAVTGSSSTLAEAAAAATAAAFSVAEKAALTASLCAMEGAADPATEYERQITILKALLSTNTAATAPHQRKTAEAEFFFGKSSKGHDKEWWDKYAD